MVRNSVGSNRHAADKIITSRVVIIIMVRSMDVEGRLFSGENIGDYDYAMERGVSRTAVKLCSQ